MRPLLHPSVGDIKLEAILHALSDPVRVKIFVAIANNACEAQACSAFAQMGGKPIPKSSLSTHFKVLREAGLIRAERHGVEVRNTSRCPEIEGRFPGLVKAIIAAHAVEAGEA